MTHKNQNSEEILRLNSVSREFSGHAVLRDVSLGIRRSDTHVVIGESGCGKSVTLKLMMALLHPSSGSVDWFGRPLPDRSPEEVRRDRLRFGFLFQNAALFDSMTVFENVAFGLRQNVVMPPDVIHDRVVERLREVGLPAESRFRMPAELSGGMRKRVGLARALVLEPEVMFYDEPTTGLDPIMSDVINELILRVAERRNVTSIVVTHDMNTVRRVADRVTMLCPLSGLQTSESQVWFEGTAADLFESSDPRVAGFVRGEAGSRIEEILAAA